MLRFCWFALVVLVVAVPSLADDPSNARKPKADSELRYWLENMIWQHRFSSEEITAATGLTAEEINAARTKFNIRDDNRPARAANAPLQVLPYPGGRHPHRISRRSG